MTARNGRKEHREMLRAERGGERLRGRVERGPFIDAEKQGQGDGGKEGEWEEARRREDRVRRRQEAARQPCGRAAGSSRAT